MPTGHTVTARETQTFEGGASVRRSEYEGGTVSYDVEEPGRSPVRLTVRANGLVRIHFPDRVMRVDLLRHSPTGWTNVELTPRDP